MPGVGEGGNPGAAAVRECEQLPGNGRADTQPLDRDVGEGGVFLVPGGAAIEGAEETMWVAA